ncbi:MFS transporter [Tersicoccus phoenicis]|uniref:MFS transporter n=1 Tax=Tersicoccus phoenicis TaxID=554083 RepID=A0A1R1LGU0_9MICC|nr:MFS transporter [Tersicoccus phoenicis]
MPAPHVSLSSAHVSLSSAPGRWIVLACVLASGLAGVDATVVNIALPDIGADLRVDFASLQWTITGYTLTLASFVLIGGSLGDRYGHRRVLVVGVAWFAVASLLCAVASTSPWLIGARALQGVGGALLMPASLAILEAVFDADDRGRAIGTWSAFSGAASAIAPFVGGWLLDVADWRWVFLINPPLAVLVVVLAVRHVPETHDAAAAGRLDVAGSLLCVVGLGALTAGLIAAGERPPTDVAVWLPMALAAAALIGFLVVERWQPHPMLPLGLFRIRAFTATNAVTFLLYAANSGALLLLVVELQTVTGFSPLLAGAALMPITVVMLLLASRFGALAGRIGARPLMAVGPLVSAAGLVLMTRLNASSGYVVDVLPAVTVFGLGLAVFVAPLTGTALASVPHARAGLASGVNNAVARAAGLVAIAALPALTGITGDVYRDPVRFLPAFHAAIWICAGLQVAGGLLAWIAVPGRSLTGDPRCSVNLSGDPVGGASIPGRAPSGSR